jgi:hypothetical protein
MCKEHAPNGETQLHVHTCHEHEHEPEHDGTFQSGLADAHEPVTTPDARDRRP